jgi:sec-independent protein translocase protein TatA
MGSFSPIHWLIVIVVILLVFGPTRLANVGKGLGEGLRNFKRGLSDPPSDDQKAAEIPARAEAKKRKA